MAIANIFGALDGPDLLIVLAIVLLLFGGTKLPKLARSLGEAKREFHHGVTDSSPNESTTTEDTVTISRAELDRLRTNADTQRTAPGDAQSN